jgi:NADPH:quinone reductase-like Zn-dependent oxidoreductase
MSPDLKEHTMKSTTQNTMKAVAIDRFGGPETLTLETLPVPEVGPDEVLIHIESADVGVWDPFEREGGFAKMYGVKPRFPYVLGTDGAGMVEAVGKRVSRFAKGDRVYGIALMNPKGGFYAEYAALNADNVAHVPEKLTSEQAGVMPRDALTALTGLDDVLGLKSGEALMIFGAGGGIGHLAVQLAKRMGARVLAVASGTDGVALAERLGADVVVNGRTDDVAAAAESFAPAGLDAALMTAGGDAADRALVGGRGRLPGGLSHRIPAR